MTPNQMKASPRVKAKTVQQFDEEMAERETMRNGNKYGAKKTEIDGIVFDSKAEAGRYQELKLLQAGGVISGLKLQPAFVLLDSFRDRDGKRHQAVKYVADFQYTEDGIEVVEDVKGYAKNRVWLLKKKLFLSRYPEYRFVITE